ncbi:MAG: hypothetical protein P8N02_06875 [Actinomycetota bacterium]|nr:hypothetical protein [Actinomycetota bacterium]
MSHAPSSASGTVGRWRWLPVLGGVLFSAAGLLLGSGDGAEGPAASTAVVQLDATGSALNAAAEHAIALSATTREQASEALAKDGVTMSAGELSGRSIVSVDAASGVVRLSVSGAGATASSAANALAETYVEERTSQLDAHRNERARFLAERSSTLTRDLLAANLLVAEAASDDRIRDRLESRLLALEVERDQLQLDAVATDDIERQLADLKSQLELREPAVDPIELARAQASADLASSQLQDVRNELLDLTAPSGVSATIIESATTSTVTGDEAGLDLALVIGLAALGLVLGLAALTVIHLASAPTATTSPDPLSEPPPRLVSNGSRAPLETAPSPSEPSPPAPAQPEPAQPVRSAAALPAHPTASERLRATEPIVPRPPVGPTVSEPPSTATSPGRRATTTAKGGSRSASTASQVPGEPETIANIPAPPVGHTHPVTINHPDSDAGVAYTELSTLLVERAGDGTTPTVSFVGPGQGIGRTTVAVNVAAAATSAGMQTLLVSPLWDEIDIPGLPVLPPGLGITDPEAFPPPEDFRAALSDVAALIDIVFIDTEPADLHPEVAALAAATDLTAVVVMAGRSNITAVNDLGETLAAEGANIAGVVVNAHEAAANL